MYCPRCHHWLDDSFVVNSAPRTLDDVVARLDKIIELLERNMVVEERKFSLGGLVNVNDKDKDKDEDKDEDNGKGWA